MILSIDSTEKCHKPLPGTILQDSFIGKQGESQVGPVAHQRMQVHTTRGARGP